MQAECARIFLCLFLNVRTLLDIQTLLSSSRPAWWVIYFPQACMTDWLPMYVVADEDYWVFWINLSSSKALPYTAEANLNWDAESKLTQNMDLQYGHSFFLRQSSSKSLQRCMYLLVKLYLYLQVYFRKDILVIIADWVNKECLHLEIYQNNFQRWIQWVWFCFFQTRIIMEAWINLKWHANIKQGQSLFTLKHVYGRSFFCKGVRLHKNLVKYTL